jgi:hypothetical protein
VAERWGYRPAEIVELTGLSRPVVDRAVVAQGVRRKRVGGAVILDARDCERVFGFAEPEPESREFSDDVLARVRRFNA